MVQIESLCRQLGQQINSLPNKKFLVWTKLKKKLADDKIDVTEKMKSVTERLENRVGKRGNAGY